jgi:hypothetical protein
VPSIHEREALPHGLARQGGAQALDSTTIYLCLSLFPWAKFRKQKAAVKMHTLLDLHGNIPTFISINVLELHLKYGDGNAEAARAGC